MNTTLKRSLLGLAATGVLAVGAMVPAIAQESDDVTDDTATQDATEESGADEAEDEKDCDREAGADAERAS